MLADIIRIGTRGSPLALAQAQEVRARLMAASGRPEGAYAIVVIRTSGDRIQDRPLAEAGGKGLFTKEIEEALIAREVDLAVHSMKDMQTVLPEGLIVGATLPREDVRDAFISLKYASLGELPSGAIVGTSSLRRHAQVKHLRPDIRIVPFRGNVQTRLKKLEDGAADATFLACAGLKRLGLADRITSPVPVESMLPAVAQGTIAIEIRSDDAATARIIAPLDHEPTRIAATAERAFLARLQGSCRTPIAGLGVVNGAELTFRGMVFSPDGQRFLAAQSTGPAQRAAALGDEAAVDILGRGAAQMLAGKH